ncbi:MAG: hypothetical protein KGN34_02475 [Sphingomonadales bacterium]|nr:hypothetical protein [Sphingomonadales bacterium]
MVKCAILPAVHIPRAGRLSLAIAAAMGVAILSVDAAAQPAAQYNFCSASAGFGSAYSPASARKYFYITGPIGPVDMQNGQDKAYLAIEKEWREHVPTIPAETKLEYFSCASFMTLAQANEAIDRNSRVRPGMTVHSVDWQPSFVKPQGAIKSYTLHYEDGEQAGHGYRSAAIELRYRFLLCADEIQIAYALDRKSLVHDDRYVVRMTPGRNFEYATPTSQPAAPDSVPLSLRITRVNGAGVTVAPFRDAIAGEALGMGCFTGQTKRVGMVNALLGPKPTRGQIQALLDTLILAPVSSAVTAEIDRPLTNADYPPPAPATKRAVRKKR